MASNCIPPLFILKSNNTFASYLIIYVIRKHKIWFDANLLLISRVEGIKTGAFPQPLLMTHIQIKMIK